MGLKMRDRYADLSTAELTQHVDSLQSQFPNSGAEVNNCDNSVAFVVSVLIMYIV